MERRRKRGFAASAAEKLKASAIKWSPKYDAIEAEKAKAEKAKPYARQGGSATIAMLRAILQEGAHTVLYQTTHGQSVVATGKLQGLRSAPSSDPSDSCGPRGTTSAPGPAPRS